MAQRHILAPIVTKRRVRRDGQHGRRRLPPHLGLRLHVGGKLGEAHLGVLRVESRDVLVPLGRVARLLGRPHLVHEAVVHDEEGVSGGGYGVAVLEIGVRKL